MINRSVIEEMMTLLDIIAILQLSMSSKSDMPSQQRGWIYFQIKSLWQ